jgi:hypothetical protein
MHGLGVMDWLRRLLRRKRVVKEVYSLPTAPPPYSIPPFYPPPAVPKQVYANMRYADVYVYTWGGYYYAVDNNGNIICQDSPTSCIQEAINYVSSNYGQGLIYARGGTYYIPTNGVTVNAPIAIVGEGDRTNIVLGGVNAITNNGPYLKFKDLQISSYTNNQASNSQQIYSSSGDLVFEDVDFYVPIDTNGGSFIYANAGDVWFIRGRLKQGGSSAASWFIFAESYPPWGGSANVHVRDFIVDNIQSSTSPATSMPRLFMFSGTGGDIDGLIVRNVSGSTSAGTGGYLSIGVMVLRNIKVLNGSIAFFDIANFGIAEDIEYHIWSRIGAVLGTTGIASNIRFYAGGGFDLGQPSSGTEVRAILSNIYLNGGTIYFGGYRYVEINNVVCDDSPNCIWNNDEISSGNPVNLVLNNISMFVDGSNASYYNLFHVTFSGTNIKTVLINNSHLYAKYNSSNQYNAVFFQAEYSNNPYSQNTLVQVSNSSMYTEKSRSQGGPYMWFIYGNTRAYETQVVRVVNGTFYTEYTLPFGYWSISTPWGTPLGRYDRIVNALFLSSYNWSPYSYENINASSSVTVGTSGSYGSAWVVQAPGGAFKDFDIAITWGGTFASGETVTVQIQVEYDDGSTNSITVSSSSTGTTWLTPAQKAQLFASNKSIVRIYISAASNESSTSVTVTAQVIGSS